MDCQQLAFALIIAGLMWYAMGFFLVVGILAILGGLINRDKKAIKIGLAFLAIIVAYKLFYDYLRGLYLLCERMFAVMIP